MINSSKQLKGNNTNSTETHPEELKHRGISNAFYESIITQISNHIEYSKYRKL